MCRGPGELGCVGEGMLNTLRSVVRFRPLHFRAADRRLSTVASVADYRRIARRRLPRGVFDYVDGGAEDELTLHRNSDAFRRLAPLFACPAARAGSEMAC